MKHTIRPLFLTLLFSSFIRAHEVNPTLLSTVDALITRAIKSPSPFIPLTTCTDELQPTDKKIESSFEDLFTQANNFFNQGKSAEAILTYQKAIQLNPAVPQAHFNLGITLMNQGKQEEAQHYFDKAINLKPTYARAHFFLARCLEKKNPESALEHYQQAITHGEQSVDVYLFTARLLNHLERFKEGVVYLERAYRLDTSNTNICFEFANTLNSVNRSQEAVPLYKNLLKNHPENNAIAYNLAYTLKRLGKFEEAMPYYTQVLTKEPLHANAHFSRSLAYLAQGNFEKGWEEYEWRWKMDGGGSEKPSLRGNEWDGITLLQDKTILVYAEQGLGDTFQFVRFAQILKQKGARVILRCQTPLKTILSLCPYLEGVIDKNDTLPAYDLHAPLMSLPYLLKVHNEKDIPQTPYLFADEKLTESWAQKLASLHKDKGLKVGICFQGNSNYSTPFLRAVVAEKSITLKQLMNALSIPQVMFYNLQKETGQEQLTALNEYPNLYIFDESFDKENGRFMDTAAVMKNLDVVVTIDTSTAHLAAGLGVKKVLLMLPEPADWRWLINRSDSPWYPTVELFRQPTPGDWDSVLMAVKQRLEELNSSRHHQTLMLATQSLLIDELVRIEIARAYATTQTEKEALEMRKEAVYKTLLASIYTPRMTQYVTKLTTINNSLWALGNRLKISADHPLSQPFLEHAHEFAHLYQHRQEILQEMSGLITS